MIVEPEPGVILVRLATSEFGDVPVPEKAHDSMTHGTVVAINPENKDRAYLMGRTAYFRKYKDDARLFEDNKLALIEIKDVLGTSYEKETV